MIDQKPREFWIIEYPAIMGIDKAVRSDKPTGVDVPGNPNRYYHVIEKSAYDELAKQRDEILQRQLRAAGVVSELAVKNDQLRADLDLAIEALMFYANFANNEDSYSRILKDGGDKALLTLAKLQELK